MRDIQPLKFFGGIAIALFLMGAITLGFVSGWYVFHTPHHTTPFTSLIMIGGVLITLAFLLGVLALLADMLGRHRRISEELLYLARRRVYSNRRTQKASLPIQSEIREEGNNHAPVLTLHDSWCLPVIRSVPRNLDEETDEPRPVQKSA